MNDKNKRKIVWNAWVSLVGSVVMCICIFVPIIFSHKDPQTIIVWIDPYVSYGWNVILIPAIITGVACIGMGLFSLLTIPKDNELKGLIIASCVLTMLAGALLLGYIISFITLRKINRKSLEKLV